jgi:protein-tyrosine phosphatase
VPTTSIAIPPPAPLGLGRWWRVAGRVLVGFALLVVAGNAAIALLSLVVGAVRAPARVPAPVVGVDNLTLVDAHVWRGAAPSVDGYESLREAGVTTIVDLRAEPDAAAHDDDARSLGLRVVHLPIRDGQTPTDAQVASFTREVDASPGIVFVHCGAGVGRTGSMVAAYLVGSGRATNIEALASNLGVGPPSLEQIAYAAALDRTGSDAGRPPLPIVVLSRILDAPRRLMSQL